MLGDFTCARYRFVLRATTPLRLGSFVGATLRGGFGHVFKRTVCIWPPGDCPRCLLKHACSYPYVFETAPPPGSEKLRGLDQVPRPYVIEPPEGDRRLAAGDRFEFRLVLVGKAIDYLPYFLFTFRELGRTGLGADLGRYELLEVQNEGRDGSHPVFQQAEGVLKELGGRLTAQDLTASLAAVPTGSDFRLAVQFLTPTRIRSEGKVQLEVSFQDLVRAILRRLSSLCYFHCGRELEVDFRGLIEQASRLRTVREDLHWHEQERFSGRQRQRIDMGGVIGTVVYEAADSAWWKPYLSLLAVGEWVHVGKGCVMGLGKFRIEAGS